MRIWFVILQVVLGVCLANAQVRLSGNVRATGHVRLGFNNDTNAAYIIITNAFLWLKPESGIYTNSGTNLAAHTQLVQQWNDQSGRSNNVRNLTVSGQPQYLTNQLDGYPSVYFGTTSNKVLQTIVSVPSISITARTFVVVARMAAGNTNGAQLMLEGPSPRPLELRGKAITTTTMESAYDDTGDLASYENILFSTSFYYHHALTFDTLADRMTYWQSGTLQATDDTMSGIGGSRDFVFGGDNNRGWIGYITEVIAWDYVLTATEMSEIWKYLQRKYPNIH